ncbi:MAG: DUF427 domain-containing protein [Pseudomonadales bacterium]
MEQTEVLALTPRVAAARDHWRWRGQARPPFTDTPGSGQISVWDFPRPPRLEPVAVCLSVRGGDTLLARTERGCRVLETAGAPTYYFPPEDVAVDALRVTAGRSLCEWKGVAQSYAWADVDPAAWCYPQTFAEFTAIRGWFAFYPGVLDCRVGDERASAQPGGYYGGWVTADLCGPIKGEPGSGAW